MEKVHCDIHDLDIVIYSKDEEHLFADDNRQEIAVFYDGEGKKYLKRCVMGRCDDQCPIVQTILEG